MRFPRLRTILLVPLALFAIFYVTGAIMIATSDRVVEPLQGVPASHETITIFGASGTAGDGILKAALADPRIDTVNVITRRSTPRIEEGVKQGRVNMIIHMDYLDYTAILDDVADSDAIYWAIGLSSWGVDEETYAMIHVDFPMRFVEQWSAVSTKPGASFHYISSSDISEDSQAMWAQQKVRAENSLFDFAESKPFKVIAYRPDYIGPTDEEAHFGQDLLFWFFRPVGAAVRAEEIGQTMIEVTARGAEFESGDKIGTRRIVLYSDAYRQRHAS